MLFNAPFRLGPFIVDAEGRLCPSTSERFPSFRVAWRGHVVRARLTATEPDGGTLALQTVLGRVPSTGRPEGAGALPRRAAFAAMRALPGTLPPGWTVVLLPDHRVLAEAKTRLLLPTSAEDLVGELALFLLRLVPYLELLAEGVGIEPAGDGAAAPGSLKTCPG
jgi:hypothetical protein